MPTPERQLNLDEKHQIAVILARRANEIVHYKDEHQDMPGSVELALTLEINRLRKLQEVLQVEVTREDLT